MVIKRDKVIQVKFTNLTREQDIEWSMKIMTKNLIDSEVILDEVLYFYNCDHDMSIDNDRDVVKGLNIKDIDHELKEIKLNIRNIKA